MDTWHLIAVSQLPWSDKDREVWFFLEKNHVKVDRFGPQQLRTALALPGSLNDTRHDGLPQEVTPSERNL
jgi:hypothetical protein